QNVVVITQPDLESTGPAVVSATFFNEGRTDQTLESVTLPGTGKTAKLTPAEGGSLTVPAGGSLILGGEGNASAVLPSSREAVQDGNAQKVTFTFSKTGDVSLQAFVQPAEGFYAEWGPSKATATPPAQQSEEPAADAPDATDAGRRLTHRGAPLRRTRTCGRAGPGCSTRVPPFRRVGPPDRPPDRPDPRDPPARASYGSNL